MDQEKISKIKTAIRDNFDASPTHYQAFEQDHGFFRKLNEALIARMRLKPGAQVLDVGCGTGASSKHIAEAVPQSRVWGLDISKAMLRQARADVGASDRITFVQGDAAALTSYFDFPFDAVIYSASIFLIPDYEQSLRQARGLLKRKGSVGLTFMDGLYDVEGNNVLALADESAAEGVSLKRAVRLAELRAVFSGLFPNSQECNEDFSLPRTVLQRFFSIPAMSAGLFPRTQYDHRLRKIERLFDHLPNADVLFRWILMIGNSP